MGSQRIRHFFLARECPLAPPRVTFLSFSHSSLILLTSEILSNKSQYRSRRRRCFCFDISESSYQIRKQEVKVQMMRLLKTWQGTRTVRGMRSRENELENKGQLMFPESLQCQKLYNRSTTNHACKAATTGCAAVPKIHFMYVWNEALTHSMAIIKWVFIVVFQNLIIILFGIFRYQAFTW